VASSVSCTACAGGRYSSTLGKAGACDACCADGQFSASTGQASCPSACVACPAGKFSLAGSSECRLCGVGKFQPASSSASCGDCPAGQYQSNTMSTAWFVRIKTFQLLQTQ
jgi:hypothetical protein